MGDASVGPEFEPDRAHNLTSDPVLRFMRLMWAADHELHSISKRIASRIGLTGPQRLVVRLIGE